MKNLDKMRTFTIIILTILIFSIGLLSTILTKNNYVVMDKEDAEQCIEVLEEWNSTLGLPAVQGGQPNA